MNDFLEGAGCVVRVKGGKPSAYEIDDWETGLIGDSLITIDDIQPTENDIARPIVAVDDYRAIYRFGKNFGQIVVRGSIYLGPVSKESSNVLSKVAEAFNEKLRLSKKKEPTTVSIAGGYSAKVYFVSLTFGNAEPILNKVTYSMQGIIAPVEKGSK